MGAHGQWAARGLDSIWRGSMRCKRLCSRRKNNQGKKYPNADESPGSSFNSISLEKCFYDRVEGSIRESVLSLGSMLFRRGQTGSGRIVIRTRELVVARALGGSRVSLWLPGELQSIKSTSSASAHHALDTRHQTLSCALESSLCLVSYSNLVESHDPSW